MAKTLSQNIKHDFSTDENEAGYQSTDFEQQGFNIQYKITNQQFSLNAIGRHNMENALAATCVANQIGVPLDVCAEALKNYEGIYRRNQVIGQKNGVWLIDDYAHNPVKCAAAIASIQPVAEKVIAWFQPHGFKPTQFLRDDFVQEFAKVLRPQDEIWMSEIYYAGGTADKSISANDFNRRFKSTWQKCFLPGRQSRVCKSYPQPSFAKLCGAFNGGKRSIARAICKRGVGGIIS